VGHSRAGVADAAGGPTLTCVDSSALVRYLLNEGDTSLVLAALERLPFASTLATVEVYAAIYSRWRNDSLLVNDRDELLAIAETTLFADITLIDVTDDVIQSACEIVREYAVRSLDALHVATALIVARLPRTGSAQVRFCSADLRQSVVAGALFGTANVWTLPPRRGPNV
jgi:predicted nucleic acid-binding protein